MDWTEKNTENYLSRIRFDFITQLEKKMESVPLTQADLAKKLVLTEGAVSQILNNPSNLTLKTIVRYARAVGLKVSIIAYDDNDPNNNNGLINSEIFNICWEKQGKPTDFFALNESVQTEKSNISTSDSFATEVVVNPEINKNNAYLLVDIPTMPKLSDAKVQTNKADKLIAA